MSGTTNFQQWNPNQTNQESDSQYSADQLRSGGATVDAILPSDTFNKLAYQVTTAVKGLMQALANKGYTTSDASLTDLTGVLQNIMTLADMTPYAPLASPAFTGTPTAPTPASGDSSTSIATTAFVAQSYATLAYVAATYATLTYLRSNYAPLNSPNLSGSPTCPTRGLNDNSAGIANTSWVWQLINYTFYSNLGSPGYIWLPTSNGTNRLLIQWATGVCPSNYQANTEFIVTMPYSWEANLVCICTSANGGVVEYNIWNAVPGPNAGQISHANNQQISLFGNISGEHEYHILQVCVPVPV